MTTKHQDNNVQISVNITAHKEGLLLYKTLRCINKCIETAVAGGITKIEVNLSLDNADDTTAKIAHQFKNIIPNIKIYKISLGDLGKSRNYLISKSKGKYIAFFDGDDFFTENYLLEAYKIAKRNTKPAVYSPEFLVSFGTSDYIIKKLDISSKEFHQINMFEHNYFISQSFVDKEVFSELLYKANSNGYGMEDWDWNMRALQKGYQFINIPNTIFFYRRKSISLLMDQVASGATLRPNPFYEPKNFSKLSSYKVSTPALQASRAQELVSFKGVKYKQHIKKIIKKATFNKQSINDYLKQQYVINKQLAKNIRDGVKRRVSQPDARQDLATQQQPEIERFLPERFINIGITPNILKSWQAINKYEPMIRASKEITDHLEVSSYPTESRLSLRYYEFCNKYINRQFDDVVVVPHIVRGGADLAIIRLIEALSANTNKDILVFSTLDVDSPWSSFVTKHPNVVFIEMRDYLFGFDYDQRLTFLLRILQNWNVKRFNIVNSQMGYDLLIRNGPAVNDCVKTYLHTYAYDMDEEGYLWNWIKNGLVETYPFVDQFITDSLTYKKQLIEINGFDEGKITPLYLPIDTKIKPKKNYKITKKVLWASRVSDSKLVDVAVEVGRKLGDKGIELHFFGSIDPEYSHNDRFLKLISKHPTIKYRGLFNGYFSLPIDDYDLFLLTSKNEGMPNVILESIKANMFVVAPAVGGIVEVIDDGKNGFLVKNNLTAKEYAEKVIDFYQNPELSDGDKRRAHNLSILEKHTKKAYEKNVKRIFAL